MIPDDKKNKGQLIDGLNQLHQRLSQHESGSQKKMKRNILSAEPMNLILTAEDKKFLEQLNHIIDENENLDFVLEECLKLGLDKFGADRIWAKYPCFFTRIKQFEFVFSRDEFSLNDRDRASIFDSCKEKQSQGIYRYLNLRIIQPGTDSISSLQLEQLSVKTALELSIQVRNSMNLVIGFHFCRTEKVFSDSEILLIKQFGKVLGYAIGDYFFHAYLSIKMEQITTLLHSLNEMLYRLLVPQRIYEYVSPAAEKLFGLSSEELINDPKSIRTVIHPDFRDDFDEEWENLVNGIVLPSYEYKIILPDGAERWIYQTNKGVFDEQGNILAIEGGCLDVTELKETEESLRESENNYHLLFDSAGEGILMLDEKGFILEANQRAADMFAVEKGFLYGKDLKDLSLKFGFNQKRFLSMFRSALHGKNLPEEEFKITNRAGEQLMLTCQFTSIIKEKDSENVILLLEDVTQEKHIQEELLASEEMFRGVVEHFPISIEVYNRDGYQIPLSGEQMFFEEDFNSSPESFNILTDENFLGLEIYPEIEAVFSGKGLAVKEWAFDPACQGNAGSQRFFRSRIYPIKNAEGKLIYVVVAHEDITSRKRTEQELLKSEERYRLLAEKSPNAIMIHQENKIFYVNPEACRLLGAKTTGDLVGKNPIDLVHPDYVEIVTERIRQTYDKAKDLIYIEEKFIRLDGQVIDVDVAASSIEYQGRQASQVVFRDIGERKKIESALRDSEEYLSITLNSIGDGVIATDKNGKITRMNKVSEQITAWSSAEAFGQDLFTVFNVFSKEAEDSQMNLLEQLINSSETTGISGQAVLLSRERKEFRVSYSGAPIKNEEGFVLGVVLAFRDETEEYEKDRLIKENQDVLNTVFRSSPIGIAMSVNRKMTWINKRMEEITGYKNEELVGKNTRVMYLNDEEYYKVEDLRYVEVREHGTRVIESKFKHKSGKLLDILLSATPLDVNDISKGVIFTLLDITTRKMAERALKKNEENLEITLKSIGDGVIATDRTGRITRINAVAEKLTGWSLEEAFGKPLSEVFSIINSETGQIVPNPVEKVLRSGSIVGLANHTLLISKDGKKYQIADSAAPIINEEDQIEGVVLVFRDVTEEYKKDRLIKENQATLQGIFNSMLVGVAVAKKRVIQWTNKKFLKMTGYESNDLIGQNTRMLYASQAEFDRVGKIYNNLNNYADTSMEVKLRRKDGSFFDVFIGISPLDPDDESKGISFSILDITDRKQAEEALRESEKRFALVIDAANDGMWDWNPQTNQAFFDENYYAMLGYENIEFPGRFEEWVKHLHPDDKEDTLEELNAYISGEREVFSYEFRLMTRSGEYMWILSRGKIVERNEKGDPVRMVGTHADITERKKAEEQLHLDETRLETLLELNQRQESSIQDLTEFVLEEGVRLTNSEVGYLAFINENETLLTMHTFSQKTFKESRIEELPHILHIEDTGLLGDVVRQRKPIITNDYDLNNPKNHGYPSGHMKIKKYMSVPVFDGVKIVAVAGVGNKENNYNTSDVRQLTLLMDGLWTIMQRKRNNEEMARLRNLLQNITDSMPSILLTVDDQIRVIQWNREAENYTGISVAEAEGKKLDEVFPQLANQTTKILNAILKSTIQKEEKINWSDSQQIRYMDITIYPLITNGITGAVIRIDNVTDRIRMEEMMIQSEKMLSVGGLAAGMAHEINNPLAGIIQSMQVIQNRLLLDTPKNAAAAENSGISIKALQTYIKARGIDKMIENVSASGKRAASIVSNMLSFSRKSAYKFEMHDIAELLDKTVELASSDYDLKKKYDFRQIKILREYAPDVGPVLCEMTKIQQVFLNILKNGAQAMVAKEYEGQSPSFTFRLYKDQSLLKIEIEDNGPGMDIETRKRIFEPFFTTKDVGEGVGLGLSVSYFIITENHNGTMTVESSLGIGTKFSIGLPIR